MLWNALSELALQNGIRISPNDLAAYASHSEDKYLPEIAVDAMLENGIQAHITVNQPLNELAFFPVLIGVGNSNWMLLKEKHNQQLASRLFLTNENDFVLEKKTAYDISELEKIYSGITISIQGTADEYTEDHKEEEWFWGVFKKLKAYYGDCIVAAVLINLLSLATSMFSMNVYDRIIPNAAFNSLWTLGIGVFIAALIELGLRSYRAYVLDDAGKKADLILSSAIYKKTLNLQAHQRPASSGHWAGQIREFESVRDFVSSTTMVALTDIPFSILFLTVIYWVGGILVLIPIIAGCLVMVSGALIQIPIKKSVERYQYDNSNKYALLIESLQRLETIESLGAKSLFQGRWERANVTASRSAMASKMASAFALNFTQWLQQIANVLLIISGVYLILMGQLTVGALIGCSILASRALTPLGQIASLIARWHNTKISFSAVNKIMQIKGKKDGIKNYVSIRHIDKSIELQDITFNFPQNDRNILSIPSLKLSRNEITVIMGPVGSGKTTLLKIIAGLYAPSKGKLLVDGFDKVQLSPADWRSHVAWVAQDAGLFRGTLRDNLLMGAVNVSDERFLRVIHLCGLDAFIKSSPQGLDMQIGEAGQSLSGGQKQMVSLARALMSEKSILLLDEPTNSLDLTMEKTFLNNLRLELANKWVVMATHRPAPVDIAHRLIILDQGKIVADGSKDMVLNDVKQGKVFKATASQPMKAEAVA